MFTIIFKGMYKRNFKKNRNTEVASRQILRAFVERENELNRISFIASMDMLKYGKSLRKIYIPQYSHVQNN
jgi:hypothetical protein